MKINYFSQIITVPVKFFCNFLNRIKQAASGVFKSLSEYFGNRTDSSLTGRATASSAASSSATASSATASSAAATDALVAVDAALAKALEAATAKAEEADAADTEEIESEIISNLMHAKIILEVFKKFFSDHNVREIKAQLVDIGNREGVKNLVGALEELLKQKVLLSATETQTEIVAFFKERKDEHIAKLNSLAEDAED